MGSFFITNNAEKNNGSLNLYKKAGLIEKHSVTGQNYFINVFKKGMIKNENYISFNNGDFAAVTGACIYRGEIGNKSLLKIYNDFKCGSDIKKIRNNAIGHYAIIIKKVDFIWIFCEKYNLYEIFYYKIDSNFAISNSFAQVVQTLNKKTINKLKLFEEVLQIGIMGRETFYKNVFQLFGHEYIEINIKSDKMHVKSLEYEREIIDLNSKNIKECIDMYLPLVKHVFSSIYNVFGDNIALEMTGGFDTRCIFSALNNAGAKARLQYGISDNILVDQKDGDLKIVKKFAKKFDRDLYIMNWKSDCRIDKKLYEQKFKKHGFYIRTYGCNDNFFKEYEGKIPNYPKLLLNGLFGENMKGREWLNTVPEDPIEIRKIIEEYHIPHSFSKNVFKGKEELEEYVDYLEEEILDISTNIYHMKIENKKIYKENFNELRQIFARSTDNGVLNIQNVFTYSLSPYGDTKLYEFMFNVPYRHRNNNSFQFELIKALDPASLEIPIFSHQKPVLISQSGSTENKKNIKELIRDKFPGVYGHTRDFISGKFPGIYGIYENLPNLNTRFSKLIGLNLGLNLIPEYKRFLKNETFWPEYFEIDKIKPDARVLSRMAIYAYTISKLEFDSIE